MSGSEAGRDTDTDRSRDGARDTERDVETTESGAEGGAKRNAEPEVVDNPERSRFEAEVDGQVAYVTYRREDGRIDVVHTKVPEELEGRGIGSVLARTVLDRARAEGLGVVASCPFIAAYIERHPEYQDLLEETQD